MHFKVPEIRNNMATACQLDEERGTEQSPVLVSGGLQQYLIRQNATQQPCKGAGSNFTTFHDLPDSTQLQIFAFLEPEDLSRISRVCRRWYSVSCDASLWRRRLEFDVHKWSVIGHSTNPDFYADNKSDLNCKEIYLRCSPLVNQLTKQQNVSFHRLSELLRSFWLRKTPKLAMFGPGMETSTHRIVRNIIDGHTDLFTVVRMFPGQFGGVGGGFTLKTGDDATLDLIMLYSATQSQRESQSAAERAQRNHLMNEDELKPAIKELCRTLDGLVYVVDATTSADDIAVGRAELTAMLSDQWTLPTNPIVILSCIPTGTSPRLSSIEIIRKLQLTTLTRPWQVHHCVVDNMDGLESAFHWLVQTCYRK